jgi:transcriptional regulator with XRE-family HTH domain
MKHPTFDELLLKIEGTWDEVADDIGISARGLYNIRNGLVQPRRATILAIAQALKVRPDIVIAAIMAGQAK